MLLCCLISSSAIAQQRLRNVSKQEAFSVVKGIFSGQDVDYYLCEDPVLKVEGEGNDLNFSQSGTWTFFVDAEPLKGWEHDCYIVRVVKRIGEYQSPAPQSTKLRLPPMGNFSPLEVKNRYGTHANLKPYVKKESLSNEAKSTAERTYAVILSGGHNQYSNHERYWNDCSFVYQTLVNKYGVPKNNIAVVMSDGTDPAADMHLTTGGYKSSPLDLDYDGQPDIQYAATRTNVKNVLSKLSQRIGKDDHLFFYVIDHGGTKDYKNQSYICLWNGESLHDYELADWLRPFNEKQVYVNAVLGQCFSGGFIEELTKVGCVVAAASESDKSSYGCYDIPYDEFVYHWTSAINGKDAYGKLVPSDVDNNNRVTMDEAFTYAKLKDRAPEEPQYMSKPVSVGEDLAFNNLPEAVDLYIKDNDEDTGKEPNLTTTVFWDSPSIWVRNEEDGIEKHENPYYAKNHLAVVVYVKIHNRGKEDYNGGKYLHMYWARASTGLTAKAWRGQEYYIDNDVTGGRMNPEYIKPIKAGGYRIVPVTWSLPRGLMSKDNGKEKHHFCLLGQIYDEGDPELKGDYPAVQWSNDIAQKNVSIISKEDLSKGITVFVRNIYKDNHKYSLEIHPRTLADKPLLSKAKLKMEMATPIYDAWKRGGLRARSITYTPSITPHKVEFNSWDGRLEDICMNGSDFEKVTMNLEFQKPANFPGETYAFYLVQKDNQGNIIGGETFEVEAPLFSHEPIVITPINLGNGKFELLTEFKEKDTFFRWTDGNGKSVGEGNKVTVIPTLKNNEFSVTALSSQGEMAQKSITLESKIGLKSVTPISVNDFINVELHNTVESKNAVLQVSALTQGTILLSKNVPAGTRTLQIDATSLSSGIYVLTYSVEGQIIDSRKFTKK
ncbi:C13 family peptidase [Prevotella falsenii]|uniref:C13 family peptidase n=1 Tax=Prevotella falsenii TaxID=515414 RepID=UPI0004697A7A|nr:C13 family peptidase [Prevotella falsenii]